MDLNLLGFLKIIGIVILFLIILFAVVAILFCLASLGFFVAYAVQLFLVEAEQGIFKKASSGDTSISFTGWGSLIGGAITGIWMAFPSGMARLSWEMMKEFGNRPAIETLITSAVDVWKTPATWNCNYCPAVSLDVNRLVAAFLDAAQYTAIVPLALAVLAGVFGMWSVPGLLRKLFFLPFQLIGAIAVFIAASAGIHFVSVPLGVAGLAALFIATFILHLPRIMAEAFTSSASGSSSSAGAPTPFSGSSVPASGAASPSGFSVESQNMFDTEVKHTSEWGPDRNLVLDEERSSIYGRVYVDKDSGKSYTETQSDSFNHPTELKENFL